MINPDLYCPLGGSTRRRNEKIIYAKEVYGPCVGIYHEDKFNRDIQNVLQEHPGATVEIIKREYDGIPKSNYPLVRG